LALSPLPAWAWNIPGHILSGIIAYQILQQENPATIDKVIAVLEKHPWYANQWQTRLQDVPVADHGLVLFMQAARWPDDIRMRDKQYHRARGGITSIGRLSQRNNRTVRTCKKLQSRNKPTMVTRLARRELKTFGQKCGQWEVLEGFQGVERCPTP
jgi:hypothetical protein